ncbi:MAG TPA: penicillin-binding protein 2 [Candidatus Limiplasma sp.]|nr:penicillin-binding protein 2 [Candidatus Limiplasma sp.]
MKPLHTRFRLVTLFLIGLLLLAGLYGVYSITVYGNRWFASSRNLRYREAKSEVIAGDIIDRNGVLLATTDAQGERVYQADKEARQSVVHLIGDRDGNVANGVDSFDASYLLGFETTLPERVLTLIKGEQRHGDDVTVTVDSKLNTVIVRAFNTHVRTKDKSGAAVVMNYKTGEIVGFVSVPVFDPANISDAVKADTRHPFWNRATQSTLPPGSTFKIITASSALENLEDIENRTFTCTGATQVMGSTITDFGNAQHGQLQLPKAFRVSCNNTFAQIALLLGDNALRRTAENFGFNDNFLFRDIVVENSTYPTENRTLIELAWSGDGQSQIAATPMHMCMVAAAIANNGVMMEPRLLSRVTSPEGLVRLRMTLKVYRRAVSEEIAEIIRGYMLDTVSRGTATAAQVDGLSIAGKTGSAESSLDGRDVTHAWFVGFIDDARYPYAVCVFVEEGTSGGGAAAPIAQAIFRYIQAYFPFQ